MEISSNVYPPSLVHYMVEKNGTSMDPSGRVETRCWTFLKQNVALRSHAEKAIPPFIKDG